MQEMLWWFLTTWFSVGWKVGAFWDAIGGWPGALHWVVAGCIGGCIGWFVYTLIRELRRTPLATQSEAEPIIRPLEAIPSAQEEACDWQHELATLAAHNPEMHEVRSGAFPLAWVVADAEHALVEAWEEQQERGEA